MHQLWNKYVQCTVVDGSVKNLLFYMTIQLGNNKLKFTVCSLFTLDWTLIHMVRIEYDYEHGLVLIKSPIAFAVHWNGCYQHDYNNSISTAFGFSCTANIDRWQKSVNNHELYRLSSNSKKL